MPRIALVTGGCGFIGSLVTRELAQRGWDVVVVDSLVPEVHGSRPSIEVSGGMMLVRGDVGDPATMRSALNLGAPNLVVHLAAATSIALSMEDPRASWATNCVGTQRMFEVFDHHRIAPEHLVLFSSRAVYGEGLWLVDDDEVFGGRRTQRALADGQWQPPGTGGGVPLPHRSGHTPVHPVSVYGRTKAIQERIARTWAMARGVPFTALRLQNVYGPTQPHRADGTGVVAAFISSCLRGEPIRVFEDGNVVRDFVHVADVVRALMAALESPASSRTIDVGAGRPISLIALAHRIAELAEIDPPIVTGEWRAGDVRAAFAHGEDLARDLGVRHLRAFEDGLQECLSAPHALRVPSRSSA